MRQQLTARLIASLSVPNKGGKVYYDAALPGFGVRITAAGHRAFVLNYRTKEGRERRLTIGSLPSWSLAAARLEAADLRRKIDVGEDPLGELETVRAAPTMRDLAERFEREHLPVIRPGTAREYRRHIAARILPALGSLKVAAVSHADIDRLHRRISADAPYQANRCASVLSKMFALAIRWKMRVDNPAKGVHRNSEEKRARYLSERELRALVVALDAHPDQQATNVFRLLLLTGARLGEVLSATRSQFDLEAGIWIKPSAHTKQKKEHRVPLSGAAVELLEGITVWTFPNPSSLRNSWLRICKAAGIEGLRIHDLRHSYASMLVNSGLSLPVIGAMLGHTTPGTTARYAHLADNPLRDAAERVGALVTKART